MLDRQGLKLKFSVVMGISTSLPCFPENKTGSYINFCSKKHIRAHFQGIFFHVQQSTLLQIHSCHLLVAAQWRRLEFYLTGAYFWGRAYITSILNNHTRAYFQVRSYF